MGKRSVSHRYNRLPLLRSRPGGIRQELVVQDLPSTKIQFLARATKIGLLKFIKYLRLKLVMKYTLLFLLPWLFLKCGDAKIPSYKLRLKSSAKRLSAGDTLRLQVPDKKQVIDSVHYYWDSTPIAAVYAIPKQNLGSHTVSAKVYAEGKVTTVEKPVQLHASSAPEVYTYTIKNSFPHDTEAYTQGLEFYRDTLYESTGLRGQSTLRKVDYTTGEVLQQENLNKVYFGEGLTLLNKVAYQLTWQENIAFVYNPETLETLRSFSYENSKEGWGLCNDGTYLYKSDGTNKIWKLDPETGKELSHIEVMTNKAALNKLNELEWINGKIYANTYQFNKEVAIIINPTSGAVEGVIDFTGLKEKVDQIPTLNVLNGIAYHPKKKTLFVTGKNWSKLFEVVLEKK